MWCFGLSGWLNVNGTFLQITETCPCKSNAIFVPNAFKPQGGLKIMKYGYKNHQSLARDICPYHKAPVLEASNQISHKQDCVVTEEG